MKRIFIKYLAKNLTFGILPILFPSLIYGQNTTEFSGYFSLESAYFANQTKSRLPNGLINSPASTQIGGGFNFSHFFNQRFIFITGMENSYFNYSIEEPSSSINRQEVFSRIPLMFGFYKISDRSEGKNIQFRNHFAIGPNISVLSHLNYNNNYSSNPLFKVSSLAVSFELAKTLQPVQSQINYTFGLKGIKDVLFVLDEEIKDDYKKTPFVIAAIFIRIGFTSPLQEKK
ncbi:MAG: hypothetical protein H0X62_11775 [Bacteroidetes bacterium]|nr:hypothetical protein [Bacteroidota bacterium]